MRIVGPKSKKNKENNAELERIIVHIIRKKSNHVNIPEQRIGEEETLRNNIQRK